MTPITTMRASFVEFIPKELEPGVLYVSRQYKTASHLCACGCGSKIITPLNPTGWTVHERAGAVSLTPSIGSWSLPCQSHYWVQNGRIAWAERFTPAEIEAVRRRDRRDQQAYFNAPRGRWEQIVRWLKTLFGW